MLKEAEETEEGLEADSRYMDNKGQETLTAVSVKSYFSGHFRSLWAGIVVPSVKTSVFLTVLSALSWVLGTLIARMRCGDTHTHEYHLGDTQTSNVGGLDGGMFGEYV